jgi:hypothetical protein
MAARKDSRIKENHRKAIQTSMLINRLSDHVVGKVEMTQAQVRSAQILLNKALPDLRSIELSGDPDKPIGILPFEFVDTETPEED